MNTSTSQTFYRPPFPSGWSSTPLKPTNLTLANTLPVGQSFLWHRHALPSSSTGFPPSPKYISKPKDELDSKVKIEDPYNPDEDDIEIPPVEEYSRAIPNPPRVICLRQSSTHLYYTAIHPTSEGSEDDRKEGLTEKWIRDYFHLDKYPSLEELYDSWRERDPALFGRTEVGEGRAVGVRVSRQDPWECLIAFITSTNNHITRISSLMHKLSYNFSPSLLSLPHPDPSIEADPVTYHLFPPPSQFPSANLEYTLRELGFGYRAGFIESTIASLQAEFGNRESAIQDGLMAYRNQDVEVVREKLIALKGVGRKVADCVMLMCMDQPSLIPIDTHLSAIAARHPQFPTKWKNKPMSKALYEDVQFFLLDKWGPMGGWCQAVMFAADLAPSRVELKVVKPATPLRKIESRLSLNGVGMGDVSPSTPGSTVLITPKTELSALDFQTPDSQSPLKGKISKSRRPQKRFVADDVQVKGEDLDGSPSRPSVVRSDSAATKRKIETSQTVDSLPASYGYKRTRSASKIELLRSLSGEVKVVEKGLGELDVE